MKTRKALVNKPSRKRLRRSIGLKSGTYICTEDNLPVHNIELSNLPQKISKLQIVKHFGKFGIIENVKIVYGKTRSRPIKCTIFYKNPMAATRALKQRSHTLNHRTIFVKPCPSWEQSFPKNSDTVTREGSSSLSASVKSYEGLLILNDYCLEKIYEYLDLRQRLRLTLCHERLEKVFIRMMYSLKLREINFEDLRCFTLWEIRQLLKTTGSFLRRITVPAQQDWSVNKEKANFIHSFVREFCDNVASIQIAKQHYPFRFVKIFNASQITELELYECSLYESDLINLRLLKNLEMLGLAHNKNINGSGLCDLRNVHKLSLYACSKVTKANLIQICKSLPLRFLDVRCIYTITYWSAITESCKLLETLKLSGIGFNDHYAAENIARLPKLKNLEMEFSKTAVHVQEKNTDLYVYTGLLLNLDRMCLKRFPIETKYLKFSNARLLITQMPSSFYDVLSKYYSEDLEVLKFTGDIYILYPTVRESISRFKRLSVLWMGNNEFNSSKGFLKNIEHLSDLQELNLNFSKRIKGKYILRLMKHCTKLKYLSLRYCHNISNEFIIKAVKILEERHALNKQSNNQPLLMLVGRTGVRRDILKSSIYLNAKHLLRISFHLECCTNGYLNEKTEFQLVDDEQLVDSDADTNDVPEDSESDVSMPYSVTDVSSDDDELDDPT